MSASIGRKSTYALSTRCSRAISSFLVMLLLGVSLTILAAGVAVGAAADNRAQADRLCEEASQLAAQEDGESARRCWEQALAIYEQLGTEKSRETGDALLGLGTLARAGSRYADAVAHLSRAAAIYRARRNTRGALEAQQQIEFTFHQQGLRWHRGAVPVQNVSPAAAEMLFGSNDEWPPNRVDIMKANLDGSGAVNLTKAAGLGGANTCPVWSPDGSMIAFQHADPATGELPCKAGFHVWVMNADGSDAHPLLPKGSEPSVGPGGWSPDGSRLVVARGDPHDQAQASIVVDLSGAVIGQVLPNERGPCCPEGCPLAFVDQQRDEVDGRAGWWNRLVVEDPDGTNRRTAVEQFIADADLQGRYPTQEQLDAAPDLPWLLDIRNWVGPNYPTVSPDHTRVAFLAALPFDPDGPFYKDQVEVWVYELATGKLTRVTNDSVQQHGLVWLDEERPYPREAMDSHQQLGAMLAEQGDLRGAIEHYAAAAKVAREESWPREEANHLVSMAQAAHGIGRYEEAISYLHRALPLYEQVGLLSGVVDVHRWLGFSIRDRGDLQGALAQLEMAARIAREQNWPDEEAGLLMEMAWAAGQGGQLDTAAGSYRKAIAIYDRLGSREQELNAVLDWFRMLRDRGELKKADALLGEAREIYEAYSAEATPAKADALFGLGEIAESLSRLEEAIDYHSRALAMYEELGDPTGAMNAHQHLGFTLMGQGKCEEALDRFDLAAKIAREQNRPDDEAQHLFEMGQAAKELGRYEEAAGHLRQALATFEKLGLQREVMDAHQWLGITLRDQGNSPAALEQFEMVARIAREHDWANEEAGCLAEMAGAVGQMGELQRAVRLYREAIAIYHRLGRREEEINAVFTLVWALRDSGDLKGAKACLEQVRELRRDLGTERSRAAADLLFSMGEAAHTVSDSYGEATDYLSQALAMYEGLDDPRGAMNAHQHLGFTLQEQDDPHGALKHFEAAVAIARARGWPADEATHLSEMAGAAQQTGDGERAIGLWGQTIAIYERLGLAKQQVQETLTRAGALRSGGELREAEADLEQARQLCQKLEPEGDRAEALRWLADQEQGFSWEDQAQEHREEALAIYQRLGWRCEEARTRREIGRRLAELGRYEEAQTVLHSAAALYRALGLARSADMGQLLSCFAIAASRGFRYEEAVDYSRQVLALYQELANASETMHAYRRLGSTLLDWQRYPEALAQLEMAAAIARQRDWPLWEADTLVAMAGVAMRLDEGERAAGLYREATAIYRQKGKLTDGLRTLCSLAGVLRKAGNQSEGEACLEQARKLCQKLSVPRDLAGAWRLLAGEEIGFFQDHQASQHREQAIAIYRKLGLAEEEAGTLHLIGSRLLEAGRFVEAVEFFEQSLAIYREAANKRAQAGVLNQLAVAAFRLGQYERSAAFEEQCIAIYEELGERETPGCAIQILNLGRVMVHLGAYEKAVGFVDDARGIYERLGIRQPLAGIHAGLAACHLGEYQKAQEHLEKALALARELGDWEAEGRALGVLSVQAMGIGDYRHGLGYADMAASLFHRHRLPFREADQLRALGSAAAQAGRYDTAAKSLGEARDIYATLRLDHAVFSVRMEEAQLHLDQLRLPEARQVLTDAGKPLNWGPGPVAVWHLAWGRYHYLAGAPDQALKRFEQAGAAAGADSAHLTACQIGLGLSHEALGDWKQAAAAYSRAVELSEQSRSRTAAAERVRFFEARAVCFRRLEAYEGLVRVLHRMHQDEEAFLWSEHTKARVLVEAMARAPHDSLLGLPAELRVQEEELNNRIAALSARAGEDEGGQQELKRVLADRDALVARLRLEYPEYASVRYPDPLRADELSLTPDEVLLAYEVTEPGSYVFLVRDGRVQRVYDIGLSRAELAALVERFRSSLAQVAGTGDLRALDLRAGEELYDLLLRPALGCVAEREHVIIVPDEMISLVPLEALVVHADGDAQWMPTRRGPSPTGVQYVGDAYVFTYWQSGTTMTTVRRLRRDVPGDRVLLVADPALVSPTDGLPAALQAGEERAASARAGAGGTLRGAQWEGLSGQSTDSHQLAQSLRKVYGERVSCLSGTQTTKAVLQRASLDQYAVLVFATHGVLSDGPSGWGQPALILGGADGRPSEDGHLAMTDVMDLHVPAEIVCLMACETGAGELAEGEGLMTMGRAFQYAGARSVLVSLWKVEDESANLLTEVFLREMAAGRSKVEALRAARLRVRESGREHPFFWAPFVLIGEDEVAPPCSRPAPASTPLG